MLSTLLFFTALLLSTCAAVAVPKRALPSGYAPRKAQCPSTPLVRPATSLSSQETAYIASRAGPAQKGLAAWLRKTNSAFSTSALPTVALTTSGGGYRSLLSGAGVIQGLDARDSSVGTSGLFQGLTYQAGLSGQFLSRRYAILHSTADQADLWVQNGPGEGGAWLLSSFAGNDYPTITSLKTNLWTQAFEDSLLLPEYLLASLAYAEVTNDILAKESAGFPPTLTDPWGRLLSYQLLNGFDGGVLDTLSGITGLSNFTSFAVPYPIITSLAVKTFEGQCFPGPNATQMELHPYEFGSWDNQLSAFTQTAYLGTTLSNGVPFNESCIVNYDNLGYVLGTSSNLFNEACEVVPSATNLSTSLTGDLAAIVETAHTLSTRDEYAVYPNPFHAYPRSSLYESQKDLFLVDGGEALQNNPIWPFIQPYRKVDVILVNDNSADTSNNFPNGSEILTTYVQSLSAGLTKMPVIPSVDTFISEGLNKRPTFFGCNDKTKTTIIYIPNVNYTFPSNEPTSKLQYEPSETSGMIANGVEIINKNGDTMWPTCLACGITKKTGTTLPTACAACFTEYCYN
ncbi:hypothetical protein MMC11_004406 [Xylographa trunciseda]|nr:hypothetical protein [Xylographa trunciseda]